MTALYCRHPSELSLCCILYERFWLTVTPKARTPSTKHRCSYCVVLGNSLKLSDSLSCGNVHVDGGQEWWSDHDFKFLSARIFFQIYFKKLKNLGCFNLHVHACVLIHRDNFIMHICLFLIIISIVWNSCCIQVKEKAKECVVQLVQKQFIPFGNYLLLINLIFGQNMNTKNILIFIYSKWEKRYLTETH